MKQQKKKLSWAKRLIFSMISLGLVVILLEIFSFVIFRVGIGQPSPLSYCKVQRQQILSAYELLINSAQTAADHNSDLLSNQVIHPYLGYVIDPTRKSKISRYGYHGSMDPILKRRPDQIIIAVVGGSFARDFVTGPGDETLIKLLQQSSEYAGKKIICLNLAISGYKQPQQLMTVNYLLALGGEFDMVINIDGFNEVSLHGPDNQRKGIAPAFPRIWNQRLDPLADPVIQRLATQRLLAEQQRVQIAGAFSVRPWRYSVTCQLIWQLIDTSLVQKSFLASKAYIDYKPTSDLRYVTTGPGEPFGEDDAARYQYLADLWQRSSSLLDRQCKANDIRYYHFLQPNQYIAGSKTLSPQERDTAYNSDTFYLPGVTKGYPLLIKAGQRLRDAGVAFTDLTQIYADRSDTIYNDTCCHVNDEGNRLLARRISQVIISSDDNQPSP